MLKVLFVCIYMILSSSGILLIKAGGGRTAMTLADGLFQLKMDAFTIAGLCCYVCSFLMFLKVVAMYELSYIVPLTTGIVQTVILLAAIFLFKERISTINLIGVFVVISGVILMNLKQKGPTP